MARSVVLNALGALADNRRSVLRLSISQQSWVWPAHPMVRQTDFSEDFISSEGL